MKRFKIALAMLSNAMLLGLAVLVLLDMRNPYMGFLTGDASRVYPLILCALGVLVGALFIASLRREQRRETAPEAGKKP